MMCKINVQFWVTHISYWQLFLYNSTLTFVDFLKKHKHSVPHTSLYTSNNISHHLRNILIKLEKLKNGWIILTPLATNFKYNLQYLGLLNANGPLYAALQSFSCSSLHSYAAN